MTQAFATRATQQPPPPPPEQKNNNNNNQLSKEEEFDDDDDDLGVGANYDEDYDSEDEDYDDQADFADDDYEDGRRPGAPREEVDEEEELDLAEELTVKVADGADVIDDVRFIADTSLNLREDMLGNKMHGLPRAVELNAEVARRHQRLVDASEHDFAEFIRQQYFIVDAMDISEPGVDEDELETAELNAAAVEERRQILADMKEEGIDQICRFCRPDAPMFDPLNVGLLTRFLSAYGTIKSRKQTFLCAKHQRKLNKVIRRARHMGIFSNKNKTFTVHSPFEDLVMERNDYGEWQVRPKPVEGVERKPGLTADDDPFPDEEIDVEKRAALEREFLSSLNDSERRAYFERKRRIDAGEDPDRDQYEQEEEDDDDDDDHDQDDDDDVDPEIKKQLAKNNVGEASERETDLDDELQQELERQNEPSMAEIEDAMDSPRGSRRHRK